VNRRRKRTIAIGAAAALAAAGGGAAYAAATGAGTDHRDAFVRDAAQRLNVTPQRLRSALQGAFLDQLQQAVKDGRLTQAQADRITQRVRANGLPFGGPAGPGPLGAFGPGPFGGPGGPGPHGPLALGLDAAATYLGLARADLLRSLQSGETLADVARAQGKPVDGLEQALLAAARAASDRAVADGRLTAAQRDRLLRDLQQHVADLVNGRGFGLRMHRDWRGGPGVPPPAGGPDGPPPWGGRRAGP
jgi:hypothetical protein